MRVIGGECRGRRLVPVKGLSTRPTSDKVREAVFDILQGRFPCKKALDLFAGTGAMGIEALSRGAREASFVDSDSAAVAVMRRNLDACGLSQRAQVLKRDARSALRLLASKGESFEVIFIDPPYASSLAGEALKELDAPGLLSPGGIIVLESSKRSPAPDIGLKNMELVDERSYGDTIVRFYEEKDGPS